MKTIIQCKNGDGSGDHVSKKKVRQRKDTMNANISNELREKLIELISRTNSIRKSAKQLGINDSTAKSIYYKFR